MTEVLTATLLNRRNVVRTRTIIAAALVASAIVGLAPTIASEPVAWLTVAAIGVCVPAVLLLKYPLLMLNISLFIVLLPIGARPGSLYTIANYGSLALAVCAWLLQALSFRRPFVGNAVHIFVALFIGWAIVTLLWAADFKMGLLQLIDFVVGSILLILIIDQIRSIEALDSLMLTLALMGWLIVIAGLYALLSGHNFDQRLSVLGMNENLLGVQLLLVMPGVIWQALRSSGSRYTIHMALSVFFIISAIPIILASGSRGSSVSLMLILVTFWFFKPLRPWGMIGVSIILCALLVAPFLLETLINRFMHGDGEETALGGRGTLWQASFLLLRDHPWLGVGLGNGPSELNYYAKSLDSAFAKALDMPSHNPFLEVWLDTGVIGLLLYSLVLLVVIGKFLIARNCLRNFDHLMSPYYLMVLAVGIAYSLSWVKGGGWESHPTLFLLLALLLIPSNFAIAKGRPLNLKRCSASVGLLLHEDRDRGSPLRGHQLPRADRN